MDVVSDGYVAFTPQELSKLFGPAFQQHVDGRPARYCILLIGLCTGMRIGEISQLQPTDFELEGTPCVSERCCSSTSAAETVR
jgi:integrase